MAILGWLTARQRLRRATQQSLETAVFNTAVDCAPWVIGGLWPVELSTTTGETASLAEYLKADLQRIASSANDELRRMRLAGSSNSAREARVIADARAAAVRRVESTLRHLPTKTPDIPAQRPRLKTASDPVNNGAHTRYRLRTTTPADRATAPLPVGSPQERGERVPFAQHQAMVVDQNDTPGETIGSAEHTAAMPEVGRMNRSKAPGDCGSELTDVVEKITAAQPAERLDDENTTEMPPVRLVETARDQGAAAQHTQPPVDEPTIELPKSK